MEKLEKTMLTAINFQKRGKKILIAFATITILIFLSVCFLAGANKGGKEAFKSRTFYLIYLDSSSNQKNLSSTLRIVKNMGGGGEITERGNVYYLVTACYLQSSDAEQVLREILPNFPRAGILNFTRKKLSRRSKQTIGNNPEILGFLDYFDRLITSVLNLEYSFTAGKITERELINFLVKQQVSLQQLSAEVNSSDKLGSEIKTCQGILQLYFNNFFDTYFAATQKSTVIYTYSINAVLLNIELYLKL